MISTQSRLVVILCALLVLALVPLWASPYTMNFLILVCLYMSFASMWNLLAGYSGLVSMGQQMFIGLGGYTVAVLCMYYSIPIVLSIALGGLISGTLSIVISLPVFRMKGVYFTIGTWIIAEILSITFSNWGYVKYGMGIFIRPVEKFSMSGVYFGSLIICIGSFALVYWIMRSNLGLGLMAIRDDEVASEAMGVNIFRCKFVCFLASAVVFGITGGLLYLNNVFIQPFEAFGIGWAVKLLFIVIVGGLGTMEGPIVGTVIFVFLQQFLTEYVGFNLVILGTITIIIIIFAPKGIVGTLQSRFKLLLFPIHRR